MHTTESRSTRLRLSVELVVLFFAVPAAMTFWRLKPQAVADAAAMLGVEAAFLAKPGRFMLPSLVAFTIVCLVYLLRDRSFERHRLWNARAAWRCLPKCTAEFVPLAGLLTLLAWQLTPGSYLLTAAANLGVPSRWLPGMASLFRLPGERPMLWAMIMVLYPLVSVWPQEVLYRAFFFHRYGPLLRTSGARIAASAIAFGFMHILFMNLIAPLLCLIGGVLFAATYERTHSTLAASIQHALYGCWIFTVGLGAYFFGGTVYP